MFGGRRGGGLFGDFFGDVGGGGPREDVNTTKFYELLGVEKVPLLGGSDPDLVKREPEHTKTQHLKHFTKITKTLKKWFFDWPIILMDPKYRIEDSF